MEFPLTWDDTYEIALELKRYHTDKSIEDISLQMIFDWTVSLPRFQDDIELVNDEILLAIYREWYEEVISHE